MGPAEEAECGDGLCVWEAAIKDLPMEVRAFLGEGQPWKWASSAPVDKSHAHIIPASADEDPTSISLATITFDINMRYDSFGSAPSPLYKTALQI